MCEPSFVVRPSSVYTVALYEKTRYLSSSILREACRLQSRERVGAARAIYIYCGWLPCGKAARQPATEGVLGRLGLPKPHLKETLRSSELKEAWS